MQLPWSEIARRFAAISKWIGVLLLILIPCALIIIEFNLSDSTLFFQSFIATSMPWLNIAKGVLVNILSAVVIFLVFKISYEFIERNRDHEVQGEFFTKIGDMFSSRVENLLSVRPVTYFEESFYETDWGRLLQGADTVTLVAAYWSAEWMRDNLQTISSAGERGRVDIYLTNPIEAIDPYRVQVRRDPETRKKVLACANEFDRAHSGLSVHFLDKMPSYMYALVTRGDKRTFYFSPYQMGEQIKFGRAPMIGIALSDAEERFLAFSKGEIEALKQSSSMDDLDLDRHIHWSYGGDRVIISLNLSCPAGCQFCYVPSLRSDDSAVHGISRELFGHALLHRVVTDTRFVGGARGTKLLLGGMTDPFHRVNSDACQAFFQSALELNVRNPIHIATRFPPADALANQIAAMASVAVSASVSHQDDEVAKEPKNLSSRLEALAQLHSRGTPVSIYLRPIIPGLTELYLPRLMQAAKDSGLTDVIIGNFYADKEILARSGLESSLISRANVTDKSMVLDPRGKLKKINQEMTRAKIRDALEKEAFRVFDSSSDYVEWHARKIL